MTPSFCTNSSSSSGIKYRLCANTLSSSQTSRGENIVRCFLFIFGLADGEMYVDDRKIYSAEKLKVGLFKDPSKF